MIKTHEFNTRWWGKPVGIVVDKSFFDLTETEKLAKLKEFSWVEYCQRLDDSPPYYALHTTGFVQLDTQLSFLLSLSKVSEMSSTEKLEVRFASKQPFTVEPDDLATFQHERFRHIPGCTISRTNQRYALWANNLIETHPHTCLQVWHNECLQGWFLSRPTQSNHLNLTLAMLTREATVSGMLLYQKASLAYAKLGYRIGEASFSATNTAVHNIYARLNARFTAPSGNWLWVGDRRQGEL